MTYVAWAVLYEGESDAAYFNVLIPRLMEEVALKGDRLPTIPETPAVRLKRAGPAEVAKEACEAADAFFLVFIHADTGGRAQEDAMGHRSTAYCEELRRRCDWKAERCIVVAPRHEMEAWALADPVAVTGTLGYTGTPESIALPVSAAAAERLGDPKATLQQAIATVRGRRREVDLAMILPAIAQRQNLDKLRESASFARFEENVRVALFDLGCL